MKIIQFIAGICLMISCNNNNSYSKSDTDDVENEVYIQAFQEIIDSNNVMGSILVYDIKDNKYFSNDFKWANKGQLPASTFKIANSIIALETGVVKNDSTLFKWDGESRAFRSWEQDLIFKEAFRFSCVPCYQKIARQIGVQKMTENLKKLEYGSMVLDSSNIDLFWLEGASRISQLEQVIFLKKLYYSNLPISQRTESMVKGMMVLEEYEDYKLSGKTGWSINNEINNGWFVGFIERDQKVYFFATNIEPLKHFDMDDFPAVRKKITDLALKQLGILK